MSDYETLEQLVALIRQRKSDKADNSYTRQLLVSGVERCARKFGEESIETIIAAMADRKVEIRKEAADSIYHLLVLLECCEVSFEDVLAELKSRMGQSGLAEKAARGTS